MVSKKLERSERKQRALELVAEVLPEDAPGVEGVALPAPDIAAVLAVEVA